MYKGRRTKKFDDKPLVQYKSLIPLWKDTDLGDWVTASTSVYKQQFTKNWVEKSSKIPAHILSNPFEDSERGSDSTTLDLLDPAATAGMGQSEIFSLPHSVDHVPSHHGPKSQETEQVILPPPLLLQNSKKIQQEIIYDAHKTSHTADDGHQDQGLSKNDESPLISPPPVGAVVVIPPAIQIGENVQANDDDVPIMSMRKVKTIIQAMQLNKSIANTKLTLRSRENAEKKILKMLNRKMIHPPKPPPPPRMKDSILELFHVKGTTDPFTKTTRKSRKSSRKKIIQTKKSVGGPLKTVSQSVRKAVGTLTGGLKEWKVELMDKEVVFDDQKGPTEQRTKKMTKSRKILGQKIVSPPPNSISSDSTGGDHLQTKPGTKKMVRSRSRSRKQAMLPPLMRKRIEVEQLFFKNLVRIQNSQSLVVDEESKINLSNHNGPAVEIIEQTPQNEASSAPALIKKVEDHHQNNIIIPVTGQNRVPTTITTTTTTTSTGEENVSERQQENTATQSMRKYYGKFPESLRLRDLEKKEVKNNSELDVYLRHLDMDKKADMTFAEGGQNNKNDADNEEGSQVKGDFRDPTELYSPFEQLSVLQADMRDKEVHLVGANEMMEEGGDHDQVVVVVPEMTEFLKKFKPSLAKNPRLNWTTKPRPTHLYFESRIMPTRAHGLIHKLLPLSRKEILLRMAFEENDPDHQHRRFDFKLGEDLKEDYDDDDPNIFKRLSGVTVRFESDLIQSNNPPQSNDSILNPRPPHNSNQPSLLINKEQKTGRKKLKN